MKIVNVNEESQYTYKLKCLLLSHNENKFMDTFMGQLLFGSREQLPRCQDTGEADRTRAVWSTMYWEN